MADLLERLSHGPVICAEGYLFELERRGYLQAGGFVPEVVLEHPEKVAELHTEDAGADVVGPNCGRGPATMLPLLEKVRRAVTVPVAGLPVPYRTTESHPTFHSLEDPAAPDPAIAARPFPIALTCSRFEIAELTRQAKDIGVSYLGVCCGAAPHHIRSMAEALGRTPPASRYSADMSKHYALGTDSTLRAENREYAERM
jgi:betaine-homocysteine S-methyltransferase